jgi:hypothetical protein
MGAANEYQHGSFSHSVDTFTDIQVLSQLLSWLAILDHFESAVSRQDNLSEIS